MVHANLNLILQDLSYAIYVIAGLCIAIIFSLGIWMFVNRKKRLVRNSSPIFMAEILLGALLAVLTIFPMGMQDSAWNFHVPNTAATWTFLDSACEAVPFMYSVGFNI